MKYTGKNGEMFEVHTITSDNCEILKLSQSNQLSLIWFHTQGNRLKIDSIDYIFNTNEIICFTEFHKLEVIEIHEFKLLRFNKPFYCVLDHDSEVGCRGILYYGSSNLPLISIPEGDIEILETVWKMLCIELESRDNLQLEMLQMMLKRILILCTRIYKKQMNFQAIEKGNADIIKDFNYLVETHFREKHGVGEYAELLFKSPKTLSNLFKKLGDKTPLQFIQDRLLLEAHRLLMYSDKSISDIGYKLGFKDIQSFSRFFKNKEGISPMEYRESV